MRISPLLLVVLALFGAVGCTGLPAPTPGMAEPAPPPGCVDAFSGYVSRQCR